MANTLPCIDADTTTFLAQAKKGKARKFAMIAKGMNVLRLVVFRKGGYKAQIQAAKKEGHKGIGYWGVVQGDGPEMTFYLSTEDGFEKPPVKEMILKKFLLEEAQLKTKPKFEFVTELPTTSETDDEESEAGGEAVDTEPSASDPAAFMARLKALKPGIEQAKSRNDASSRKIQKFVDAAATCGRSKEFDKGLRILDEVEKLLREAPAAPSATTSTASAAASQIPPPGWDAERTRALVELKNCIKWVAASKDPDAGKAELQLRAVVKQLSGKLETRQQAFDMKAYLENDDVVADVSALAYDLKTPLLKLLGTIAARDVA